MHLTSKQLRALHALTKTWKTGLYIYESAGTTNIVVAREGGDRWTIKRNGHVCKAT